ncbi:hypothetical protein FMEAI12_4320017 [Parafrankia sp. Ea1.12]|nr:hypothetical protein FMEAI12_4320017 [Parafrankia sp. Ea1.12]
MLGPSKDDLTRYRDTKARRNYSGTSPTTRASGKKTVMQARYATNYRLADRRAPGRPSGGDSRVAISPPENHRFNHDGLANLSVVKVTPNRSQGDRPAAG